MTDFREAVRAGVALLDEHEPGWRDRIVPAELEMETCGECVIGQVFGTTNTEGFLDVLDRLGVTDPPMAWHHGATHGFSIDDPEEDWGELRDAWIGYIKGEWS